MESEGRDLAGGGGEADETGETFASFDPAALRVPEANGREAGSARPGDPRASVPAVHRVLGHSAVEPLKGREGVLRVTSYARQAIAELRERLGGGTSRLSAETLLDVVAERVAELAGAAKSTQLGRVVNATGVVLHTGLGRAPLSERARQAIAAAAGTVNLELDLEDGERRPRGHQLAGDWRLLTGAEDSLVVNNNAGATLLALSALAAGREVIVSRGQLVEIGGSYRLPDIFAASGAILREVGTTNRTHLSDYAEAITDETAAILRVHPANYRIVGFAEEPGVADLVQVARDHDLWMIDDIGSGAIADLDAIGLGGEPTFPASIAAGADLVLGSGDKLLGGPQAGIVLGRAAAVDLLRRSPLARCLRIDKLTLAALAATLESYRLREPFREIPTLRLLSVPVEELQRRATEVASHVMSRLADPSRMRLALAHQVAPVGGGSLPGSELATICLTVSVAGESVDETARRLRLGRTRVLPRITRGKLMLDFRSIPEDRDRSVEAALSELVSGE